MKKCDSCETMNANNSRYYKNCGESVFQAVIVGVIQVQVCIGLTFYYLDDFWD